MGTSKEVDAWFERYENPMKDVVRRIRAIVLGADARMEECIKPIKALTGHSDDVVSAVYSPDGKRAVTASWDNTARLWDVESGKTLSVLTGHRSRVERVAFSPDGQWVASTSWDETTRMWDAATGKELRSLGGFPHPGNTWPFLGHGLAISPDGRRVTSALGRTLFVWDARSGEPLRSAGRGPDEAGHLEFSADSTELWVTAPSGKVTRTWRLGPSGARLSTEPAALGARPPSDRFSAPVRSPDGRFVARALVEGCADLVRTENEDRVVLLCTVPGRDAGLVLDGSLFEYVGSDACAARELLACQVGSSSVKLPLEVCEERFLTPGLLAWSLAGRQDEAGQEAPAASDCPTRPY